MRTEEESEKWIAEYKAKKEAKKKKPRKRKRKKKLPKAEHTVMKAHEAQEKKLAYYEEQIKKYEEYRNLPFPCLMVKLHRDLTPTQQILLAMVRGGIRSTGLMREQINATQATILRNLDILRGKRYIFSHKQLYFPQEFPVAGLKKAVKDFYDKVHTPIQRDTHRMHVAKRQQLLEMKEEREAWNY